MTPESKTADARPATTEEGQDTLTEKEANEEALKFLAQSDDNASSSADAVTLELTSEEKAKAKQQSAGSIDHEHLHRKTNEAWTQVEYHLKQTVDRINLLVVDGSYVNKQKRVLAEEKLKAAMKEFNDCVERVTSARHSAYLMATYELEAAKLKIVEAAHNNVPYTSARNSPIPCKKDQAAIVAYIFGRLNKEQTHKFRLITKKKEMMESVVNIMALMTHTYKIPVPAWFTDKYSATLFYDEPLLHTNRVQ